MVMWENLILLPSYINICTISWQLFTYYEYIPFLPSTHFLPYPNFPRHLFHLSITHNIKGRYKKIGHPYTIYLYSHSESHWRDEDGRETSWITCLHKRNSRVLSLLLSLWIEYIEKFSKRNIYTIYRPIHNTEPPYHNHKHYTVLWETLHK